MGVIAHLLASPALAAPPEVNYVFPAGVQVGESVEVTASGKFDAWPVQVWVDRPGLSVSLAEDKGKLTVTADAGAEPGLYWFRFYNAEGASAPRPFFVGTLPEIVENEPNDDYRKLQTLDPPIPPLSRGGQGGAVVNGRLARGGDVDSFAVELQADQTLVASMEANRRLGAPMDGVLQIVSADGFVLQQNDDCHGTDPQIAFTAPKDGTYIVRTFAFPASPNSTIGFSGADAYIYRLTITTAAFVDHALPLAVPRDAPGELRLMGWNLPESIALFDAAPLAALPAAHDGTVKLTHPLLANTLPLLLTEHATVVETETAPDTTAPDTPQPITLPATITGRIDPAGDADTFEFTAAKDQKLAFAVAATRLGYALDPVLQITDADGKVLAQRDDNGRNERDVNLDFTAPADGTYRITVRDLYGHGGFRYVYRLEAAPPRPDFALTLEADRFTLTPGKPLEIPVNVERRNGFAEPVAITVDGLPETVTVAAATSEPTGDSAKQVKLRLETAAGPFSGPITLLGRAPGDDSPQHTATAPIPALPQRATAIWLTVTKP